jgi:chromosome segregation ATPase
MTMRRLLSSAAILCVLTLSVSALAQPKSRRRGRIPPGQAKKTPPPPPAKKQPDNAALCASRQSVLTQEQNRLDAARAELASIDTELDVLKRRITELNNQRNSLLRAIAARDRRVQSVDSAYKKDCTKNDSCSQYETMAGSLEQQASDVETELALVRSDISTRSSESAQLSREIDPLRREYANLQCNNLVPGSTAQSTIDRCAAIFSQWNRLQARVNQLNNALAALQSRYQRLLSQLKNIEARGKNYETYLARNCSTSPQLAKVRGYGAVRMRAEKLGKELDRLIDTASKLRGIEVTVTPRR